MARLEKYPEVAPETEKVIPSRRSRIQTQHLSSLPVTALPFRSSTLRGEGRHRERQPLSPNGWCAGSGGSNVSCSHAAGCPLFPHLRASLQGWRDHYCDSEDRWLGCARYRVSLTGERVPISLLPNGARARYLEEEAEAGRSGATDPGRVSGQAPPPRPAPSSPETAPWSQPAPARPYEESEPGTATPEAMARFGATSPPISVWPDQPSPSPQIPRPSDGLARHARQAPSAKRGWRARLADWMRGPA